MGHYRMQAQSLQPFPQTNRTLFCCKKESRDQVMKNLHLPVVLSIILSFILACNSGNGSEQDTGHQKPDPAELEGLSKAYFGSGCFWCVEAIFESVRGVEEAVSGYAGGEMANPTYSHVSSGQTNHAETVEVYYDPEVVNYMTLLDVFFGSHDPTTLNRQGPDVGPQYRSLILYQTEEEKQAIEQYINQLREDEVYDDPITTEVKPLQHFWEAEAYHQDYERRHPDDRYIRNVSIPRIEKFKEHYPELLKEGE
jgi:peptide-methionine (S)-S-oxide reductase